MTSSECLICLKNTIVGKTECCKQDVCFMCYCRLENEYTFKYNLMFNNSKEWRNKRIEYGADSSFTGWPNKDELLFGLKCPCCRQKLNINLNIDDYDTKEIVQPEPVFDVEWNANVDVDMFFD